MKFYFCQVCGTRITEHDIEANKARDKKLKGVYCDQCAVGVSTMESLPMSEGEAREVLGKTDAKPPAKRQSGQRLTPASSATRGNRSGRLKPRPDEVSKGGGMMPYIAGAAILLIVALVAILMSSANKPSDSKRVKKHRKVAAGPSVPEGESERSKRDDDSPAKATSAADSPERNPTPEQNEPRDGKTVAPDGKQAADDREGALVEAKREEEARKRAEALKKEEQERRDRLAEAARLKEEEEQKAKVAAKTDYELWIRFRSGFDEVLAAIGRLSLDDAETARGKLAAQEGLGAWAEATAAMKGVIEVGRSRMAARKEALARLVGVTRRFQKKDGRYVRGKVERAEENEIVVQTLFKIGNDLRKGRKVKLSLDDMTDAERARVLARWKPEKPNEWVWVAARTLAGRRLPECSAHLAKCGEHPLRKPMERRVAELEDEIREANARKLWEAIQRQRKLSSGVAAARNLLKDLQTFKKEYGRTRFAASPECAGVLKELSRNLTWMVAGLSPAVAAQLKGELKSCDPNTGKIMVHYDLRRKDHIPELAVDPALAKYTDITPQGVLVRFPSWGSLRLPLRAFRCKGLKFSYRYKCDGINPNRYIGASFGLRRMYRDADYDRERPTIWAMVRGGEAKFGYPVYRAGGMRKTLHRKPFTTSLAGEHTFAFECDGRRYVMRLDGNVIAEYEDGQENQNSGVAVLGGFGASCVVTEMTVEGHLDPAWVQKASKPKQE